MQPFLTCWLLQNLTWCTLHPHILGVAAVKMQYWWYAYKYFALIAPTDVKYIEHNTGFHITRINTGRSADSLKEQKHSGILVARYSRIYKEIVICDPVTNLKAKPNRNTLRFRLNRYHVTMISIALPISFWISHRRVIKIFGIYCAAIYCSFVKFYHRFGNHIKIITNDRLIPSIKHAKHNAKE